MKCPSCGAETQGEICEYCRRELPKEKDNINITNNYYGDVPQQEGNDNVTVVECVKCGSTKIKFDREKIRMVTQSNSRKKYYGKQKNIESVSQSAYRTIGMCQNCGYTWDANKVQNANGTVQNGANTWLWVLGWIFIFPLPLTILMLRKNTINPKIKYGIIIAAWILYLLIGVTSDDSSNNETTQTKEDSNSIWAEDYTSINDFDYYIDGNKLYIKEYEGEDSKIRINSKYTIEGKEYIVKELIDGTFVSESIDSVIIPEGVVELEKHTFNCSDVKYVYLPSTLKEISSSFLGYFHDVEKIYYGGSEEQWKKLVDEDREDIDVKEIIYDADVNEFK